MLDQWWESSNSLWIISKFVPDRSGQEWLRLDRQGVSGQTKFTRPDRGRSSPSTAHLGHSTQPNSARLSQKGGRHDVQIRRGTSQIRQLDKR